MSEHGNGLVLIFARTDTKVWHTHIFPKADAILFFKGRIHFVNTLGENKEPAGAASALIAYGKDNVKILEDNKDLGYIVYLKKGE